MGLKRGDLVWARVTYPKKWWPGLVHSVNELGIAVSFFSNSDSPRYFLETEVCSFQDNFESLVGTLENCNKDEELLDTALKLLARRVVSRLRIGFRSDAVLDFVVGLAVSPFVGVEDLVWAVTAVAQLNAFRGYVVNEHKLFLRSGVYSVTHRSDASELELESLNEDQPNPESWVQTEQTHLQSLPEMLINLRSLALDTNNAAGECLNAVMHNILMFRNSVYRGNLNLGFEKGSCRSNEAKISYPSGVKSQPSVKVDKKYDRDISASSKANAANPTLLGLKRQYNCPVNSDFSFKLCKTMPLFSINKADAEFWRSKPRLDALISGAALSHLSLKFCNPMPFSFFNGTGPHLQINRPKCEANTSYTFFSGQLEVFIIDGASSRTRNYLPSPHTMNQIQIRPSGGDDTTPFETHRQVHINTTFRDSLMENKKFHQFVISDVQPSNADDETPVENRDTNAAFRDIAVEKLHPLVTLDLLPNGCGDATSFETNMQMCINTAFGDSPMENKKFHQLITADVQPTNVDDETPVETNGQVSINGAFRDNSIDIKKFRPHVTSDVSFKLQVAQLSTSFSNSHFLHMKFPKDFNLPSKEDLIRKFSRFGKLNLFRTKIYRRMSSARVVFLNQLDAVAAYHFAKRKKCLFTEANILFWLDPYEKERRGSKFAVSLPNPKSCLKKSYLHGHEDKKRTKRVRFVMETD